MFDHGLFERYAERIIAVSKDIHARGWSPATSSNFSHKLDDSHCVITVSGRDKGKLTLRDLMVVDLEGKPCMDAKPSAETILHTRLYRRNPAIGAILHTHSPRATQLTRLLKDRNRLTLAGYELLKAFESIRTHDTSIDIPIFDNSQDIPALADKVDVWMDANGIGPAYLIRGHGLYTWGSTIADCMRHLEALEYLLDCEWQLHMAHRA